MNREICGFEAVEPESKIERMLADLHEVNEKVAFLADIKRKVEQKILEELKLAEFGDNGKVLSVAHNGAQSHQYGKYKVIFKTPVLWKLNKKEYIIHKHHLREEFNPVIESISYRVSNSKLDDIYVYGSAEDKAALDAFIEKDYSKPSITLTLNAG